MPYPGSYPRANGPPMPIDGSTPALSICTASARMRKPGPACVHPRGKRSARYGSGYEAVGGGARGQRYSRATVKTAGKRNRAGRYGWKCSLAPLQGGPSPSARWPCASHPRACQPAAEWPDLTDDPSLGSHLRRESTSRTGSGAQTAKGTHALVTRVAASA
jgi:hypothetical protein